MVKASEVAEQAVANNWLTILSRGSMIVCAFSLPVIWSWAGSVDDDRAKFDTAIQLLQKEDNARKEASTRNTADMLALASRVALLEIAGSRSDAQQQSTADNIKEILSRITRIEEGLGRRGDIPWPHERADAGQ